MSSQPKSLLEDVAQRVAVVPEPFIVPDVRPIGVSPSAVFHVLRDMVEDGTLKHTPSGYYRVME